MRELVGCALLAMLGYGIVMEHGETSASVSVQERASEVWYVWAEDTGEPRQPNCYYELGRAYCPRAALSGMFKDLSKAGRASFDREVSLESIEATRESVVDIRSTRDGFPEILGTCGATPAGCTSVFGDRRITWKER